MSVPPLEIPVLSKKSLDAVMNFANWPAPQHCAFAVDAVVVLRPEPCSLFFRVKPLRQELIRNFARKPNKNKALASGNNLPQSGILVSPNQL